jgi:ABC-2 type transport system ATP-binding protein
VAGHDIRKEPDAVRRSMGLTGQAATVDELLTARENLKLIGRLYGLPKPYVAKVSDELLERFSLTEAANRTAKTYSGGMRRRLDLAVSLIAAPPVLFLDEPTTGLDPRSRTELWEVLRGLVRDGTTLLLTTQYLEEADHLADDIIVIDKGKVIAAGTPTQLKDQAGAASVVVTVTSAADLQRAAELTRTVSPEVHVDETSRRITAKASGLTDMTRMAHVFEDSGIPVDDLGLKRPSLDDVFLHLTGHKAEEVDDLEAQFEEQEALS